MEAKIDATTDYVNELEAHAPGVSTLILRQEPDFKGWTVQLDKDAAGRFTRLAITVGPKPRFGTQSVAELVTFLDSLPPDGVTAFTLRRSAWTPGQKVAQPIAVALKRFGLALA